MKLVAVGMIIGVFIIIWALGRIADRNGNLSKESWNNGIPPCPPHRWQNGICTKCGPQSIYENKG